MVTSEPAGIRSCKTSPSWPCGGSSVNICSCMFGTTAMTPRMIPGSMQTRQLGFLMVSTNHKRWANGNQLPNTLEIVIMCCPPYIPVCVYIIIHHYTSYHIYNIIILYIIYIYIYIQSYNRNTHDTIQYYIALESERERERDHFVIHCNPWPCQTDAGKPPEPKEPEMDNQTKAQKLLETYWTLLSGRALL